MPASWSDLRRRVARIGASLDVVVRSDPEVCGLSGSGYHLTLHHSGYGDCTVGTLTLIDCPNELVLIEFERWMRGAGHTLVMKRSVRRTAPPRQRRMFQHRRRLPAGIFVRQMGAILLMIAAAAGIVVALQRLPEQVDVVLLVSEAVADLIRGVQQLLEALLGLGAVVLIALMVLLATVLTLGAIWRMLRLLSMIIRPTDQSRR